MYLRNKIYMEKQQSNEYDDQSRNLKFRHNSTSLPLSDISTNLVRGGRASSTMNYEDDTFFTGGIF